MVIISNFVWHDEWLICDDEWSVFNFYCTISSVVTSVYFEEAGVLSEWKSSEALGFA